MAAVLAYRGRAVASFASAGAMIGITKRPANLVHVTLSRKARPKRGIAVHCSPLDPTDIRRDQRIPLTNPARTLLDLASCLSEDDFEQAAAEAWALRLVTRPQLQAQVDRHPHRPGTPSLRTLLELDRDPALTRSKAERRLLKLIRTTDLPEPETNAHIGPHEVDCLWRPQRFIVEFDSWTFHSSRKAFERDRRKDAELLALGYRVLRVTWRRLTREPGAVMASIAAALTSS